MLLLSRKKELLKNTARISPGYGGAEEKIPPRFFNQIIKELREAVAVVDCHYRYLAFNPGMERRTHLKEVDVLGKTPFDIFPAERAKDMVERVRRALSGETVYSGEVHLPAASQNDEAWFASKITPLRDESSRIVGAIVLVEDITERKRVESIRNQLAAIVEFSNDAIVTTDLEQLVLSWNTSAERIFGYPAKDMLGKNFSGLIPLHLQKDEEEAIKNLVRGSEVEHLDTQRYAANRHLVEVTMMISPIKDPKGLIIGYSRVMQDISASKAAQKALMLTQFACDNASDIMVWVNAEGKHTYANITMCNLLGYSREELMQLSIFDISMLLKKEDWPGLWEDFKQQGTTRSTTQLRRKDGSLVLMEASSKYIHFDGEEYRCTTMRDITERQRTEALLAAQKKVFEKIAAQIPLSEVLQLIADQVESLMPEMLCSILLLSADGQTLGHGVAASLPDAFNAALKRFAIGPRVGSCGTAAYRGEEVITTDIATDPLWAEYRNLALDNGLRACWSIPIFSSAGEGRVVLGTFALYAPTPCSPDENFRKIIAHFVHLSGVAIERDRIQAKLALIKAAVEQAVDGIVVTNAGGYITFANTSWARMHGYQADELMGKHISLFHTPEQMKNEVNKYVVELNEMGTFSGEIGHMRRDGTSFQTWMCASILQGQHKTLGYIGTARDITERKHAEAMIIELNARLEERVSERTAQLAAKSKELESFCYSVSHDLKAPLRGIDGYSRLLLEDYNDKLDEEGRKFLMNVRKATHQMTDLIEDLLTYSRQERRLPSTTRISVKQMVDEQVARFEADFQKVNLTLEVDELWVAADRESFAMALRNLFDNALKFSVHAQNPAIKVTAQAVGTFCRLSIKDNGTGFDMRYHNRIFEIFQRLHRTEDYPGTGIGLALVRKAVERVGGRVWAESTLGEGAQFFMDLPLSIQEVV